MRTGTTSERHDVTAAERLACPGALSIEVVDDDAEHRRAHHERRDDR
jgi:hypothetical protein